MLVHVEHQARRASDTGRRLFLYAAWLMDRYNLPVYPVLVTSYDQPRNLEPDHFVMQVRGLQVVDFRFRVVQLNQMDWHHYARLKNPAATALLAKMNFQPRDRVKVRLQILRLIATLRLNPAKMGLIAAFMETYLKLTAKQELAFRDELRNLENEDEKEAIMEFMTSWERKGWQEGQLYLVKRQLNRRVGALRPAATKRLDALTTDQLSKLAEALLDFKSSADFEKWLTKKR